MAKQQPEHIAVCPIRHVKIALIEGIVPHRGKPWLIVPNPWLWGISFKRVQL